MGVNRSVYVRVWKCHSVFVGDFRHQGEVNGSGKNSDTERKIERRLTWKRQDRSGKKATLKSSRSLHTNIPTTPADSLYKQL